MDRVLKPFHFLTFGAGESWRTAAARLALQARSVDLFESVEVVTDLDIFSRFPEFEHHRAFVAQNRRGWGYWLWKPFLIRERLRRMKEGEALVYADAGFEIVLTAKQHLASLLRSLDSDRPFFLEYAGYESFKAIYWTKQKAIDRLSRSFELRNVDRITKVMGGFLILTKTPLVERMIDDWYRFASSDEYSLIDDSPCAPANRRKFFEHRHDQSILSFVVAGHDVRAQGNAFGIDYIRQDLERWPSLWTLPVVAARNATATSWYNPNDDEAAIPTQRDRLVWQGLSRPHLVGATEDTARRLEVQFDTTLFTRFKRLVASLRTGKTEESR